MTPKVPKVGDTLYSLNIGNAARRAPQVLTPVVVTKVGRKYLYAGKAGRSIPTKYHLENLVEATNYTPNSCLYYTPDEWEEEKRLLALQTAVQRCFRGYGLPALTAEQCETVLAMFDEEQE